MKKVEAEKQVSRLAVEWVREVWTPQHPDSDPSPFAFMTWLREHHFPVTCFKTTVADPQYFIHLWFDRATGQSWKN